MNTGYNEPTGKASLKASPQLETARQLLDAGLSIIPIKTDGSKAPSLTEWKSYQTKAPTGGEIEEWFGSREQGIGIVCGAVSGNLEVIDFDDYSAYDTFRDLADRDPYIKSLLGEAVIVGSPTGLHLYYRCEEPISGNQKLACLSSGQKNQAGKNTLIETRGEGGYVIAVGSPASTHPSGELYKPEQNDYYAIPTISSDDRELLLSLAKSLNQKVAQERGGEEFQKNEDPDAPGNAYNEKADWSKQLTGHGWRHMYSRGDTQYWQRPGKESGGPSATLNHGGTDRLYVFSSNAEPFESERGYSKFQAYALLEHGGDFSKAAKQLLADGYGKAKTKDGDEEKANIADKFLASLDDLVLFHDDEDEGYADVPKGSGKRAIRVKSESFRDYLGFRFFNTYGKGARDGVVDIVVNQLSAKAKWQGARRKVFTRVAEADGSIYVDLCNEAQEVVRIDREGWTVIGSDCPVSFTQPKTALPMPTPIKGGSLDELWSLCNPRLSDADKKLILAFLFGCLHPSGPYAHLVIEGAPGSGKTTLSKVLKQSIDPSKAGLRALPANEQDLAIGAHNSWLLAFDNIDTLTPALSDALARLSTGGGLACRKHYSQDEEAVLDVRRPVIFNGINKLASRPDLLSRCIVLNLESVEDVDRKTEAEVMDSLMARLPLILGALFTAISGGLRNKDTTKPNCIPRLADFAVWAAAVGTGLGWGEGEFLTAFNNNQLQGVQAGLEQDPLAVAIVSRVVEGCPLVGTASELLSILGNEKPLEDIGGKAALPKANKFFGAARMIEPALKKAHGICLTNSNTSRGAVYKLEKIRA